MKAFCPVSGTIFNIADTFGSVEVPSTHPVFNLPTKFLFSRAGDWAAGKLNEQERKLLFLALLNKTDLVQFRTPAAPTDAIVQQNMEHCFRITSWILGIKTPSLSLPSFVVSNETRSMSNVHHWLLAWESAKKDFEDGYVATSTLSRLRNREAALERLIKNAHKKADDYSGLLAAWAFDATAVPEYLREVWKAIFLAKGVGIYSLRAADIDECIEHMEENLEHGSIYASATLSHLRLISRKNKQGLGFGLGMLENEYNDLDLDALSKDPFKIIVDSVEEQNRNAIANNAPEEMPIERNYPSRVAYLRAKIAFEMAIKARAYADEFTTQVESELQLDEQVNKIAEFEESENDESDILDAERTVRNSDDE